MMVDENLPPRLARGLNALFEGEHKIVHLLEKFGRTGVTDEEWIKALGAEGGWSVLSGDISIAKKRPSRALLLQANVLAFFPLKAVLELPLPLLASRLLRLWPNIVQLAEVTDRGLFEIAIKSTSLGQLRE